MAWLPHQLQPPLRRRNLSVPYYPGAIMPGQSPLAGMPGMLPNTGLAPLHLTHNRQFPNPLFTGRAASLGATAPFVPFNPAAALQRPFYPPHAVPLSLSPLSPLQPPYGTYNYPYYTDPPFAHPHTQSCSCPSCHSSMSTSNSNTKNDYDFKLKDVTVRGKVRSVRVSYLLEAPKFEADLVKYMEKKKEDDVPDKVVDMLISWINREDYTNDDPFDEVTLNILASNVGCKSIAEQSLGELKKMQDTIQRDTWVGIIGTVYLSSKVDEGLKKWLTGYLKEDRKYEDLYWLPRYRDMVDERPEVHRELWRGMGLLPEADDKGLRQL